MDRTTSFLQSVNPKTGSTSIIVANAAVDNYSFSKNCNAFQRGDKKGGNNNNNDGEGKAALVPGEVTRESTNGDFLPILAGQIMPLPMALTLKKTPNKQWKTKSDPLPSLTLATTTAPTNLNPTAPVSNVIASPADP